MTDKMREEFEAAIALETGRPVLEFRDDRRGESYASTGPKYAWWGWKASRESLVIDLPPEPTVPDEPEDAIDDSFMDGYYAAQGMRHSCAQFIKAAGLKVKP